MALTNASQTVQISSFGPSFSSHLGSLGLTGLTRAQLSTVQINLGKLCNQACEHCHVDAGPKRTEIMQLETMQLIVEWCKKHNIRDIDITGGAPEMTPDFRWLVDSLVDLNMSVTSRCNLTILMERGYEDLAEWYAQRKIKLVCSMPCYSESNVDGQRGKGVFHKSIAALQQLNSLGYGSDETLRLDLVYNPAGAFLPPDQVKLEADYKREFKAQHDIEFNQLFALCNLPINRFARFLHNNGEYDNYLALLTESFNPDTINSLMCRHLISVDWRGFVYDCDFNQMLNLPMGAEQQHTQLWNIDAADLFGAPITVANHCYGCTAGSGSSCGGSLI